MPNSSFLNKKFTLKDIPLYINLEENEQDMNQIDKDRNVEKRFLGKDGVFNNYKILVGCFCKTRSYLSSYVNEYCKKEFQKRGFQYEICMDFDIFTQTLNNYDIVWLICTKIERDTFQQTSLINAMDKFFRDKKSLYLWADYQPYYQEANLILNKFFNGMKMELQSLLPAVSYLKKSDIKRKKLQKGTFDSTHSIAYGISNMLQAQNQCQVQKIHKDFKSFNININGQPCILYAEENENHGRIVIDNFGVIKCAQYQQPGIGIEQYISNANIWLTGIPQ